MKKIIIFLTFISLFSAQIDIDLLIKIAKNDPSDIKTRLILTNYFIKKQNYKKAKIYLDEILKNSPKNKEAKRLKRKLKRIQILKSLLKNYGVSNPNEKELQKLFENLSEKKEYKKITIFYKLLSLEDFPLNDKAKYIAASAFLKLKKPSKTKEILTKMKDDFLKKEILADICFFEKRYICAQKKYISLLKTKYDPKIMHSLLNLLYERKDYQKFKTLYDLIKEKYKKDFDLNELDRKLISLQKELLKLLKKEYETKKDFYSLKAYSDSLFSFGKKNEAIKVAKEFLKQNPSNLKSRIYLSKLLFWRGLYSQSLKTISPIKDTNQTTLKLYTKSLYYKGDYERYFNITKDPKTAKYLAQKFYLKGEYKKAIFYFEAINKKDKIVLYQYAISLQKLKKYKKALEIYKKILNKKDPNYFDIKYRYGFCLLKLNKEKDRKKAKKIFQTLLDELKKEQKQNPSKKIENLITYTKQALKVSKRKILKPKKYKDIILAEGLSKQYREYKSFEEAANVLEALPVKLEKGTSIKKILPKVEREKERKRFSLNFHYLKDSNNLKAKSLKTKIDKIKIKDAKIGFYGEKFEFEKTNQKIKGFKKGLLIKKGDFEISLGINDFENFNDPYYSFEYETSIYDHIVRVMFQRQNAIFYENEPYMAYNRISALNLLISDYLKLNQKELSSQIAITKLKDGNIRINPAFSYIFLRKNLKNITNYLLLTGWYQFYKKKNPNYAYEKKDDTTRVELHSKIALAKKLQFTPKASFGYSFFNDTILYSLGFLLNFEINPYSFISLDCINNKTKSKNNLSDYNYKECYGDFYYRW